MLRFLIPTAKEMVEKKPEKIKRIYSNNTKKIIDEMSQKDLSELLSIYHFKKDETALKEQRRWRDITSDTSFSYKALNLYNGLMYRTLKTGLSNDAEEYLNQTTFVTTALYGIIPISEFIKPHRLDFNTSLSINNQSLKKLWKKDYDNFIESLEQETIISLLSSEFETVFSSINRQKLITVRFYEQDHSGKWKQHSTISKKGRGYFLKAAAMEECQTIKDLKALSFENYHFKESNNQNELIYIRKV
ncbi:peroxide stress protein YaaA [Streptococcus sp. ZJ151]|uniref:peroxide stress protein YaaA n=1 Tax=Streptococcus jiangjianxini TaxID=3161189 RepID=UPI0032EF6F57